MAQLEYSHDRGNYFAGVAVHTRQFTIDDDGEMVSADEAERKTTCAWWVYGEQSLWRSADKDVSLMAQYSENTSHKSGCYRYAEIGGAYRDSLNECGVSGQYARYHQGKEYSLELTWKRQINKNIAIQPTFQYVNNANGDFTVLSARIYYSF